MSGVVYSAMNGIQPSLYGEMFPTRGAPLGHGDRHADRLRDRRLRADGGGRDRRRRPDGWVPVAGYVLGSSLIAADRRRTARETCKSRSREIDGLTDAVARRRRSRER